MLTMQNSKAESCLIAHVPVNTSFDWTLLTYIPMQDITKNDIDWPLVIVVSLCLMILLVIDILIIMRFNRKLAAADVASGTKKRESLSENFTNNPFKYSFHSVPVMENGGAVLEVPSVEFSVNKNSKSLEMTNEFMRFLLRTEELNNLAMIKRLITCSTVYSFDDVYAPLGNTEHLYQLEVGILDNTYSQLRAAAYRVLTNRMTVDEAVANYGKY